MATQEDILDALLKLEVTIESLPERLQITPPQVIILDGLSELSENLGMIMAGEFRAGNRVEPGKGFSGMRMAYPPMYYASDYWNLVGIENDVMQIGIKASDGKLYAGGGRATLDENGVNIYDASTDSLNAQIRLWEVYGDTYYQVGNIYGDWGGTSSDAGAVGIFARHATGYPWSESLLILGAYDYETSQEARITLSSFGGILFTGSTCSLTLSTDGDMSFAGQKVTLDSTTLIVKTGMVVGNINIASSDYPIQGTMLMQDVGSTDAVVPTPVSGMGVLYVRGDKNLYFKNSDGTEYQLTP